MLRLSEMDNDDIFEAVQQLSKTVERCVKDDASRWACLSSINTPLTLNAKFKDGTHLAGESEISAAGKTIEKVWVTAIDDTEPQAVPEVIDAI